MSEETDRKQPLNTLYLLIFLCVAGCSSTRYLIIEQNEKFGFINYKGTIKIEPRYQSAELFTQKLAAAKLGGKWGYIDKKGKRRIDFIYDNALPFRDGYAAVSIDDKWHIINPKGKKVIDTYYDYIFIYPDGIAFIRNRGLWGILDINKKKTSSISYTQIIYGEKGSHAIVKDGVYGLLINDAELWFNDIDMISDFSDGRWIIYKNLKYGYMSAKGQIVIEPVYKQATPYFEGFASVKHLDKYSLINDEGITTLVFDNDVRLHSFYYGVMIIARNGDFGIMKPDGTAIYIKDCKNISLFYDDYALIRITKDGFNKYGYINKDGKIVIDPTFEKASLFRNGAKPLNIGPPSPPQEP